MLGGRARPTRNEVTVSHVREALDGATLLAWALSCRTDLEARRAEIDALNVFPIADADTGTNLLATMRAAVACADTALAAARGAAARPGDLGESGLPAGDATGIGDAAFVARALARGATVGARGNSGIILSQVLRGVADAVVDGPLTGARLRVALGRAAVLVRTGLSAPVEGTILTVLDRAAVAAAEPADPSLAAVARAAADGAALALNETPDQLGVLRAAGVVDAGARGLLVLLDCLVEQACGEAPARRSYLRERGDHDGRGVHAPRDLGVDCGDIHGPGLFGVDGDGAPDPHFEVMYVLSGTDDTGATALRERLAVLGDSVVVVGDGDGVWSAHVHCRDAGAAIEAGLAVGRLARIRVESFAVTAPHGDNHHDAPTVQPQAGAHRTEGVDRAPAHYGLDAAARVPLVSERFNAARGTDGVDRVGPVGERFGPARTVSGIEHAPIAGDGLADRGILAVVAGADAARLFEDAGAAVLRGDRQLETDDLLRAIRAMPHREVLVLPNGALPAQELVAVGVAARDESRDVLLLPSSSTVQGLAALAVHDRGRIAVDDAFAMSEAAASTRWGALRAASVRALTMVGTCSPGDGLGLVGHDVVVIDPDVVGAGRILLDRMLGLGGELVTLLMGAEAGPELAQVLADHVTAGFPGVDVVVYSGGQQADLVQIGVE
ncbi:DAK2 domain-containing protein [Nocardia halotolerans]|uniref:DAK2 domain-containing protein n=1 Tax=Nocardia halotolerans TaxID=1755878 RepID=A0ABV8VHR4_9NOCA